jgi:uncharacterized protein
VNHYRAPRWFAQQGAFGGNMQTIWPALFSRHFHGPAPRYRRERWPTPDADFIDVDWQQDNDDGAADRPLLVLFHGLEGNSRSYYAQVFAGWARSHGWRYAVPHFRGCSGELNLAPRAYHAGDHEEVGWILARLRQAHRGPIVAVGVSLGGNALLRWAQEAGDSAAQSVRAVASVSAPLDLAAASQAIGQGFNRLSYNRMFLNSLKPKALLKLAQHPGLFDRERLVAAKTVMAFDDVFNGPLHGFEGAADYYARCSAKPQLSRIRIPALVLNARNDPFIPAHCLPRPGEAGACVTLWQPEHGGHVGFPDGRWPGHVLTLPERVMAWLMDRAGLDSFSQCKEFPHAPISP